jgi:DNA-directed RNA polymerase specialized sigma24 family protein
MKTASRDLHQDDLGESAILGRITAHHSEFLPFIAARVGEPAAAEDILQSAYVKALEHSQLRDEESVAAWFYPILRNAIIDHYRRGSARSKAHELFGAEAPTSYEAELEQKVCAVAVGTIIADRPPHRSARALISACGSYLG